MGICVATYKMPEDDDENTRFGRAPTMRASSRRKTKGYGTVNLNNSLSRSNITNLSSVVVKRGSVIRKSQLVSNSQLDELRKKMAEDKEKDGERFGFSRDEDTVTDYIVNERSDRGGQRVMGGKADQQTKSVKKFKPLDKRELNEVDEDPENEIKGIFDESSNISDSMLDDDFNNFVNIDLGGAIPKYETHLGELNKNNKYNDKSGFSLNKTNNNASKENKEDEEENYDTFMKGYFLKKVISQNRERTVYEASEVESNTPVRIVLINKLYEDKDGNYVNRRYNVPEVEGCDNIEDNIKTYENSKNIVLVQSHYKLITLADISQSITCEKQLLYIMMQILNSLQYMHSQGISINNLSPEGYNVVKNYRNSLFNIKLFDYSCYTSGDNFDPNIQRDDYHDASVIFYYLVAKAFPHEELSSIKKKLKKCLSKETLNFINKLSTTRKDVAIKIGDLIEHSCFKPYNITINTVNLLMNNDFLMENLNNIKENLTKNIDIYDNLHTLQEHSSDKKTAQKQYLIMNIIAPRTLNNQDRNDQEDRERSAEEMIYYIENNLRSLSIMIKISAGNGYDFNAEVLADFLLSSKDSFSDANDVRLAMLNSIL